MYCKKVPNNSGEWNFDEVNKVLDKAITDLQQIYDKRLEGNKI